MPKLSYLRSFRLTGEPHLWSSIEDLLKEEGFAFEEEPFSPCCRRLLNEPIPLGSSLAAIFGYIYIQDRSSMLPPLALAPQKGAAILDMCASPGSKSGFLAQLAGKDGMVLANELNASRLETLRANMRQANFLNVTTCSQPGEKLAAGEEQWDYILLDPPCSGWGTEEKNPLARKLWQGAKLDVLTRLQRALLSRAASLLAPGGRLLYSTCTTNYGENEAQTQFAENSLGLERLGLDAFPGFVFEQRARGEGCLLVEGKASGAQGFYLSLLRKPDRPRTVGLDDSRTYSSDPVLQSAVCDFSRLPAGTVRIFGGKVRFIHYLARNLPQELKWRGPLLGKVSRGGRFHMDPRMRCLLPDSPRIELQGAQELRALLKGQSARVNCNAKEAGLWWRGLPLGAVSVKSGRIIAGFR